ncbi:two component transcriptional regulator, arac family protein [Companilactobacillus crustorum]|uniref:Two component transcriptional regulator, arac family protein n=3 Tax=Companilactobacillus crustorum TaxID=392416 RepID=A0A837RI91_9LACO|nr:AraC family transcriptional regulator [Companilactobacillus crustorum]KRK43375.1 two component transcriptional regulator, arac family protein [Companilactobacillus crustorum JCM 15951]KRO20924.1 two component transcriptional regulator, arac family protein [Companilactobacillus crustorum]
MWIGWLVIMEEFDLQSLLSSNEKLLIYLLQSYAETNDIAIFILGNEDHLRTGIFGDLSAKDELLKIDKTADLSKLSVNKFKYDLEYSDAPLKVTLLSQRVGKVCVAKDVDSKPGPKNLLIMQMLQKQVVYLRHAIESISKLIIENRGLDDFIIKYPAANDETIDDLSENEGKALQKIKTMSTSNSSIISAIEYIDDNLDKRLTLDKVSSKVYLSDYYFSKLFKRETGLSFSVYLNARKIQKAMILLKETEKNVNEISDLLGFTRLSYFSQTFKKYTGYAPTKYRTEDGN